MSSPQFADSPIKVEAHMTDERIRPQTIIWGNQTYTVTVIGRQWSEEDGTHILIEVHDSSRMEIKLGNDLNWRLQRYWPPTVTV